MDRRLLDSQALKSLLGQARKQLKKRLREQFKSGGVSAPSESDGKPKPHNMFQNPTSDPVDGTHKKEMAESSSPTEEDSDRLIAAYLNRKREDDNEPLGVSKADFSSLSKKQSGTSVKGSEKQGGTRKPKSKVHSGTSPSKKSRKPRSSKSGTSIKGPEGAGGAKGPRSSKHSGTTLLGSEAMDGVKKPRKKKGKSTSVKGSEKQGGRSKGAHEY